MNEPGGCQVVALVRHGHALSTSEDPTRPLSIPGRQGVEMMATWLASRRVRFEEIRHSDKLRARQTAQVFAYRLGLGGGRVVQVPGLEPHSDPSPVAEDLRRDGRSVVIVAHLPLLSRLAGHLLGCPGQELPMRFDEATVLLLGRCGGGYRIEGLAGPELI